MEVNMRWRNCPVKFRVRWVGYGEKDDTWEFVNNLSCPTFVQDFLQISGRNSEYEVGSKCYYNYFIVTFSYGNAVL